MRSSRWIGGTLIAILLCALPGSAQQQHESHPAAPAPGAQSPPSTPPMQHEQMPAMRHEQMMREPETLLDQTLHRSTAGTGAEPVSSSFPMLMTMRRNWMLMFHGLAFFSSVQQSGPRGGDKIFSGNWWMPMAQRELGPGRLSLRAMLSLEPATVADRYYPELLQTGETAFGRRIVDGQHPHDFVMELAGIYDLRIGERTLLSFYGAPVGDPAMGPTAYPHRISASENPLAPLGHHLQDSTHIANTVVTVGLTNRSARIEMSGFHGREPDENRWNLDGGAVDSWSARLSIAPAKNWSAQYSVALLNSPENGHPDEDILRMTASLSHHYRFGAGHWATTLVWGRNRATPAAQVLNSYLAESTLRFMQDNFVWGRFEHTDRTNELLLGREPEPPGFEERFLARVQAYTLGYARQFRLLPQLPAAIGGQINLYGIPDALTPFYGSRPKGAVFFLRLRPEGQTQ